MFFAMFLGGWEVILILTVFVMLLGVKSLPPLSKFLEGLRQGIDEVRKASAEVTHEIKRAADQDFDGGRP
ncbi:MAG TPA: hypothetical protein VNT99_11580, partial [Methylomirabilota bacterium]|nr:hypothetical protein [Methylomirabilota bacterium]